MIRGIESIIHSKCQNKQQLEFFLFDFSVRNNLDDFILTILSDRLKTTKDLKSITKTLRLVPIYRLYNSITDSEKIKKMGLNIELTEIDDILNKMNLSYKKILDSTCILASELSISNSLELSILFSYLLYNGYYSKTGEHKYKLEDRSIIPGFFSYDIFNGNGVCLNYSTMLSDILRNNGYKATIIVNKVHDVDKPEYKMKIARGIVDPKINTKIIHSLLSPLSNLTGNHACTLIIDNDMPYIYDSTNLTMFDCVSNRIAKHALGKGEILLKPYLTAIIVGNEGLEVIKDLSMKEECNNPYSKDIFINTSQSELDKYNKNRFLIDDFYSEIKKDINDITEKGKVLIKK